MWFLDCLFLVLLYIGFGFSCTFLCPGAAGFMEAAFDPGPLSAFMPSCDFLPFPGSWQGGPAGSFHLHGSLSMSRGLLLVAVTWEPACVPPGQL